MERLSIGHVGLHVRDLEEEIAFLELLGAEVTSIGQAPTGRVAFVSLDGVRHHSLALFEDGAALPSGNSKTERTGVHHIAMPAATRADVQAWQRKLAAQGLEIDGPYVQGPEGGRIDGGSGSYAIFFNDPNGICFEIYAGAMTLPAFRKARAADRDRPCGWG